MPLYRAGGITGSFVAGQVLYGVGTHSSLPVLAKGSGAGTAGAGSGTFGLFFRDSTPQLGISTPAVTLSGSNNAIGWFGDPGEADESFLIVTNYNGTTTTMDAELGYKDNSGGAEPNWTTAKHVFLGPCVAIPLQLRTSNVGRMLISAAGDVAIGPGNMAAAAKFHVRGAGSDIALFQDSSGNAVFQMVSSGRIDLNRTGGSNMTMTNSSTGAANLFTHNTDTTGGTGIEFQENTGATSKLAIGYGNSAYTDALRTGKGYIWVGANTGFVITDSTRNYATIDQTNASAGWFGLSDGSRETTPTQTVDATVTTISSFTPTADRTVLVMATVMARKSDDTQGAGYSLIATFRVTSGGVVTQIGATTVDAAHEDDATWDCTIDTDGTLIRVRATGKAATTIKWTPKLIFMYGAN